MEAQLVCPECGAPLNLSQPDEEFPTDLLATCGPCRRWYVLGEPNESGEVLLLELPGISEIDEMMRGPVLAKPPRKGRARDRHSS